MLQSARDFVLNGEHLDVVSKLDSLGIHLRCAEWMSNDVSEGRVKKGIIDFSRIRWAPLPLQTKISLTACFVRSDAMYGLSCRWLRSQAGKLTADSGGRSSVVPKGHFVDPMQKAAYQSQRQLRRMAEQRPEAFVELQCVWHCHANGEAMCGGPVAVTHSVLLRMGCHWQAPGFFLCGPLVDVAT